MTRPSTMPTGTPPIPASNDAAAVGPRENPSAASGGETDRRTSSDLAIHAMQDMRASLSDLRVAIARAERVSEVFPLWEALRQLEQELWSVTLVAGDRAEALLEERTCQS